MTKARKNWTGKGRTAKNVMGFPGERRLRRN
jgi:hypothetical protein